MSLETYIAPNEQRLISRFWQSASEFWRGPTAWRAWFLVGLLIAIVLLQLLTQYWLNFWNRDFFNAIERKDGLEIWTQAERFVPLAAASLALAVLSVWARMTMQRRWRESLSGHLYDIGCKMVTIGGFGICRGSIKPPNIESLRMREWRPTCRST